MWKKRLLVALISGAILGVFCIIGAMVRFQFERDFYYLFSLWYNRLLMGLVIGICPVSKKLPIALLRGAVLGIVVSMAFFPMTEFTDVISFAVGAVYGIIIEAVAFRVDSRRSEVPVSESTN
ncbi:MAG: hypothetical protein GXY43_06850 [Clostridiaceae bacterium]|nr:hypothetical protein [Clostridiaceae bacterium]